MILFIVTDTHESYRNGTGWARTCRVLEDAAADACVMLHFKQVTRDALAGIRPWAICHSGASTDYREYDVLTDRNYRNIVRETDVAQIGFCGGHQIIARFFGSTLGAMRRLRRGEPDPAPYRPGYFKEWGVYPVRVMAQDPLFRGCGKTIRVQEYHYWEVKRLGPALRRLASSADCRVQAFRHRTKPIYGTQFHPEQSPDAYPDGTKILRNFFRLAKAHREGR